MKTRNLIISSVILASVFSCVNSYAAEQLAKGEQSGIYIGQLAVQPSVIEAAAKDHKGLSLKRSVESLDTQLISALSSTRVFQIVERKRKADIEQEQGFANAAVDLNDKDAAKQGKMAGAKYALLPQIDGFQDMVDVQEYKDIQRYSMRRKLSLSATVTVVDTTTGRYLPDVANVQLSKEEIIENAQNTKFLEGSDSLNVELAKEMANQLCQKIVAILRPAKILAVTGKQILINRGLSAGFKQGRAVDFFAYEEVKDEDSGETFRNEVPVGKGQITRSEPNQSYASIVGDNLGVAKGCIVKLAGASGEGQIKVPLSSPGGSFPEQPRRVPDTPAEMTPGSSEKPLNFDMDDSSETVNGNNPDKAVTGEDNASPEKAKPASDSNKPAQNDTASEDNKVNNSK